MASAVRVQTRIVFPAGASPVLRAVSDGRMEVAKKTNKKRKRPSRDQTIQTATETVEFKDARGKQGFRINGKVYAGICKLIDSIIFPDSFDKSKMFKELTSRYKQVEAMAPVVIEQEKKKAVKHTYKQNALKRGTRIHKQLETWFNSKAKVPQSGHVHAIVTTLQSHGLEIVKVEQVVWDHDARSATRIDITCRDKFGNLKAIDLKTSIADYGPIKMRISEKVLKEFNAPFNVVPPSIMNSYHYQSAETLTLAEKSGMKMDGGCGVLYLNIRRRMAIYEDTPAAILKVRSLLHDAIVNKRRR